MYLADLHIHSRYSIATGKQACLEAYHHWARTKGIQVLGTGDFTHPKWLEEIRTNLEPLENGFFRFRNEPGHAGPGGGADPAWAGAAARPAALDVMFCLSAEISSIYKKDGKTRKVHSLIYAPSVEVAARIQQKLASVGNIASDGRPILGLEAKQLLELVLEISPRAYLVPAHVWTPWFALFGSKSGFDRIEECFEELTPHIFALETGLSSDPAMNWRWSELDRFTLISNSDAHSPPKVGREANIFDTELSYDALFEALKTRRGFQGTYEFFPQEGKYHLDGHRACGVCLEPEETARLNNICPVCGRKMTVGVLHRVLELADRSKGVRPPRAGSFRYHIPLPELLAELSGRGAGSKAVCARYAELVSAFGSEFRLLFETPEEELARHDPLLAEAVKRMRAGQVQVQPGFDGQFGVIRAFEAGELARLRGQNELFAPGSFVAAARKSRQPAAPPVAPQERAGTQERAGRPAGEQGPAGQPDTAGPGDLNPRQQALLASRAPVLRVSAGPGTGKTRLLTAWIADLVRRGEASAAEVLAVTFTNKAARQMRERLDGLLGQAARQVTVSTFHAFCWSLVAEAEPEIGSLAAEAERRRILSLLEPALSPAALKRRSRELGRELGREPGPETGTEPGREPGPEPEEGAGERKSGGPGKLKQRYLEFLTDAGQVDLTALIPRAVEKLRQDAGLAAAVRGRYRVVAVDELQDINPVQYSLLRLLFPPGEAQAGRRLLVIGDPNQSIYGFRGSEAALFDRFAVDYPVTDVALAESYRCPSPVLTAAHELIARNSRPPGPALQAAHGRSRRIRLLTAPTAREEGRFIAAEVERLVGGTRQLSVTPGEEAGYSFADIAVLTRTHRVAEALLPYLSGTGIPVSIGRHASLFSDPPLTVFKSMLALLAYPRDAASLLAVLGSRPGLFPTDRARALCLAALASEERQETAAELLAALSADGRRSLTDEQAAGLAELAELLREAEELRVSAGLPAVLALLSRRLPAADTSLAADPNPAADPALALAREAALAQVTELAEECGSDLKTYLRRVELSVFESEGAWRPERVKLLTFHAAKGLEFPVVFIAGAEESITPVTSADADLEEERRLFYVALTRARERVIITRSRTRRVYGRRQSLPPSRFLAELPLSCLEGGAEAETGRMRENGQLSLFS